MMLVLENLMPLQHLPVGMPYSSWVCLVCESLDIFYPAVFGGASPNGRNSPDQQLFLLPSSFPSTVQLANSFFLL